MRQSQLFTKTKKESPQLEEAINAQLLIRAGFIYKEFAGVYSFLPLGLRVLKKIESIIRKEMESLGAFEIHSTTLQKKEIWEQSQRWDDNIVDNWFKTKTKKGTEIGLAFTHEEAITAMMKSFLNSYKDLPVAVFDIRNIFRNEERAKSGLLRGREFFWKALYSFSKDEKEHFLFYEKVKKSYMNIFQKLSLGEITYLTYAHGSSFSPSYSHEFQAILDIGEDTIYLDEMNKIALNEEILNEKTLDDLNFKEESLKKVRGVEIGNIFSLGEKFSRVFDLSLKDKDGKTFYPFMGSYGIGISRIMGVLVEKFHDEKGILWPISVAPFFVHLLVFEGNEQIEREAENLYNELQNLEIEVLFDDRKRVRPGEKLADADLIGIPVRLVISERSKEQGGIELKMRNQEEIKYISIDRVPAVLQEIKDSI